MSIKTMKQRIALVAVTALTAGLFSVVSAPVANAAVPAIGDVDLSASTAILNVGVCSNGMTNAYGTSVATVRSGADYQFEGTGIDAGTTMYATLTGPAIFKSHTLANAGAGGATLTATTLTDGTTAVGDLIVITVTGVGTVQLAFGDLSTNAPIDIITITSVAACANAAWSSSYSFVMVDDATANNATSNVDDALEATAGASLYIKTQANDAYATAITTGTMYASATNGAVLNYGAIAATPLKGTGSVATVTAAQHKLLRVDPAQTATTSTTTVTISLGTTVIATKILTFYGEAATISIDRVRTGRTGSASSGYVLYTYKDSGGTTVPGSAASFLATSATTRITTSTSAKAPTFVAAAPDANGILDAGPEAMIGSTTKSGVHVYTCGGSSGTQTFTLAAVTDVNANVITAPVNAGCNGSLATYTVSLDKAAYKIGEVATITITGKDSSGNPVSDNTTQAADGLVSVGGGSLTRAAVTADLFTGGVRTYQAQMTTEGTFNTVVSLTGSVTTSATAAYTVSTSTTSVSNADVLKSIVSLIASINKQIQALQKLILARR